MDPYLIRDSMLKTAANLRDPHIAPRLNLGDVADLLEQGAEALQQEAQAHEEYAARRMTL